MRTDPRREPRVDWLIGLPASPFRSQIAKKDRSPREDLPTPLIETNTEGSVGTICLDHFEKLSSLTGVLSDEIIAFSTPSHVARQETIMIGKLNHVAIAVPDLEKATAIYRDVLGAKVSAPLPQPIHGVTVVFVELPNTKLELLLPLGDKSPIKAFSRKTRPAASTTCASRWTTSSRRAMS